MSTYVTATILKRALELDGTTFADYEVVPACAAANGAINNICGRVFDRDVSSPTTRYYRPQSADLIIVDDLSDSASVILETDQFGGGSFDKTWTLHTEFEVEPLNAIADGRPYTRIVKNPRHAFGFPAWAPRSVKVTAKFGWPGGTVPDPVITAATLLATRLLKRVREAPLGVLPVQLDVGSAVRIARTDPDVAMLLNDYVREPVV